MAADEAPCLTRKMVVVLTSLVFLLCYLADNLKCRPGGRRTFCTGRLYEPCLNDPADLYCTHTNRASNPSRGRQRPDYDGDTTPMLIVHIVEVMPNNEQDRQSVTKRSFASYFRAALQADFEAALSAKECGNINAWCDLIKELNYSTTFRWTFSGHDSISFPYRNLTTVAVNNRVSRHFGSVVPAKDTWMAELKKHLPDSRETVRNRRALAAYFPSLSVQLEKLYNEVRYAGNLRSTTVVLAVFVVVDPGVYLEKWAPMASDAAAADVMSREALQPLEWANSFPEHADAFGNASYEYVSATLDNLITFKSHLDSFAQIRVFIPVRLGFPAHSFAPLYTTPADLKWDKELMDDFVANTSQNASLLSANHERYTLAALSPRMSQKAETTWQPWMDKLCSASGSKADTCRSTCAAYLRQSPYVAVAEPLLARHPAATGRHARMCNETYIWGCLPEFYAADYAGPAYINCYHSLMAAEAKHRGAIMGEAWESSVPSAYFSDCLHLTESGMEKLAQCMATAVSVKG